MPSALTLQNAAIVTQMLQQRASLHPLGGTDVRHVHGDRLALGLWRNASQSIVSTVLEDERDGLDEALTRLLLRVPLAVRAGHLGAEGDHPFFVAFENARELVTHAISTIDRPRNLPASYSHCWALSNRASSGRGRPPKRALDPAGASRRTCK